MKTWVKRAAVVALAAGLESVSAQAAPFGAGNLVVYRIGDGVTARATNEAAQVYLDEYSATGSLVQSLPMPASASGSDRRFVAGAASTSEGMINRSSDGRFLTVTGYDAALGTAAVNAATSAAVNRVVGVIGADGSINTSTAIPDAFSANNIRSAVSTDGNDIWVGGAGTTTTTGVYHVTLGSTGPATLVNNTYAARNVAIYGGQLFFGTTTSAAPGVINALGNGTPPGLSNAAGLPGLPGGGTGSTNQFVLLDLDAGVAGLDTLYEADDTGVALKKWSLVSGTWVANGVVGGGSDDYDGLTAVVNGTSVTLFATRLKGASADEFVTLTDSSGYNGALTGTPTVLATAGANQEFRGVALTPLVPEPSMLGVIMLGMTLLRRRRRREV